LVIGILVIGACLGFGACNLELKMQVHFIGIGGIGISALAKYYLKKGHKVSGSDLASSEITDALKEKGAKLFIGKHKVENLPKNVDLVIYSPAVQKTNPELKKAYQIQNTKYNIRIMSYPEALGDLTKQHFTIAISGTHGKSTTTCMIGLLLTRAGLDPTVIVGTKLKQFGDSNCRVGKSKYLVIEADEHFASFLSYWPKIIVLTNIEADHLDYYKNLKNILRAFRKYIFHLPINGFLVANRDDSNIKRMLKSKVKNQKSKLKFKIQNYSLKQKGAKKLKKILKIPGEFNVSNALAALIVARILKIPDKISFKAISEYHGSWRRFEIKKFKLFNNYEKRSRSVEIISDYGHHPTEIKVTLKAAREKYLYPPKFSGRKLRRARKIWCVFQPHQYQRIYYLFKDFVKVLSEALQPVQGKLPTVDKLIITDIYDVAGREEKTIKKKVGSKKLVEAINKRYKVGNRKYETMYIPKIEKVADYLKRNLRGGEVLIIMGAGDIYKLAPLLGVDKG